MSYTVIKIENLSKLYRLGLVSTGTISHDLNRWWCKVCGKEDPYLTIGETNDRSQKGESDYVWALKDINLEVKRGERIGIIGRNGAGKSTLLKILSQVTGPTTGCVKMKGRVGSLLEVGTGFHPELTGRENIYMNGTILGMKRWEVKKKLDEIVDFAGVERYLDTPVKRYSSGMKVRLGFAVAAHLEPDILIVDEVLAVGDAEFQKKAIGKMKDVSESDGRTILFVSHNMGAIESLCNKSILIKSGTISYSGNPEDTVRQYLKSEHDDINGPEIDLTNVKRLHSFNKNVFHHIKLRNQNNELTNIFRVGDDININLDIDTDNIKYENTRFIISIENQFGVVLTCFKTDVEVNENLYFCGKHKIYCIWKKNILAPGTYTVSLQFSDLHQNIDAIVKAIEFDVVAGNIFPGGKINNKKTILWVPANWQFK